MEIRINNNKFYIIEYYDKGTIEKVNGLFHIHLPKKVIICNRKGLIPLEIYNWVIKNGKKRPLKTKKKEIIEYSLNNIILHEYKEKNNNDETVGKNDIYKKTNKNIKKKI